MDPLFVRFDLKNIHCTDEGDGPGLAEPYLWTVFFKIDGDTARVDSSFKLQGTATVVGTPGDHGDLKVAEVDAGNDVAVPSAIGHFETTLKPIPTPIPGLTVGGILGCVVILMEEDSTPADAVAQGHAALNKAMQDGLNGLIPTLAMSGTNPDTAAFEANVMAAVTSAIAGNVNFFDVVWGYVSFGNGQDDLIGTGHAFFPHSQLDDAVGKPIPLGWHWINEGDWTLTGSVSVTKRLYDAVWRPGTSGEFQHYGLKLSDLQKTYDGLWKQNYRIYLLNSYEENGQRLYDAVFRPGTSGEYQFYGLAGADLQKTYDGLWKQNYRIYLLNTYEENGQRLYDAVFRPGTVGELQFYGLTATDFQNKYDDLWKQGYRVYLFNSYEENGRRLYDAVFRPGTAAEFQFYGLLRTDFQSKYDDLWKQNYRLYTFNTYIENNQILYDAVWRPATDAETQFYGLGSSDLQSHYDDLWKKGWRIALLNTYEVGAQA